MVLSLRASMEESNGEQSEEDNEFLDQLQSFEKDNRRIITAIEIQKLEMEHKEFVMNYFVYHQQINSVADYEASFLQLKRWAETWNEEKFDEKWVMSIFVQGLKEEIKDCVKIYCPDSLQRPIVLAKWQELCIVDKVFDKSPEPTETKVNSEIGNGFVYHEVTEQEPSAKVNSIDLFTLISSYHVSMFVSMFAHFISSSFINGCGCQALEKILGSKLKENGLYWGERGKMESTEFYFSNFLKPFLLNYNGCKMLDGCNLLCLGDVTMPVSAHEEFNEGANVLKFVIQSGNNAIFSNTMNQESDCSQSVVSCSLEVNSVADKLIITDNKKSIGDLQTTDESCFLESNSKPEIVGDLVVAVNNKVVEIDGTKQRKSTMHLEGIQEKKISTLQKNCMLDFVPTWEITYVQGRRSEMEVAVVALPHFLEIPTSMITQNFFIFLFCFNVKVIFLDEATKIFHRDIHVEGGFGKVGYIYRDQINAFLTQFSGFIEGYGPAGYALFVAVYVGLEVLAIPAIPLIMSPGLLFGSVTGTVIVSISGTITATVAFLITRYFALDRILKLVKGNKKFLAIDKAIGENGFKVVTLLRLSPLLPFFFGNYLYGLTSVKFVQYVLGSWLGMLPGTWAYVSAGAFGRAIIQDVSDLMGALIFGYAQNGFAAIALELLIEMRSFRFKPDWVLILEWDDFHCMAHRRWEREQGRRDVTEDMSEGEKSVQMASNSSKNNSVLPVSDPHSPSRSDEKLRKGASMSRRGIYAAISYMSCAVLLVLFNKAALSSYSSPSANVITLLQKISSSFFLYALHRWRLISFHAGESVTISDNSSTLVPIKTLIRTLPLALTYLFYMIVSIESVRGVNVPMYTTLRRTTVVFTMLVEYILAGQKHTSSIIPSVSMIEASLDNPRGKTFQRNVSNLEVWSDNNKEKKLYIVLIILHGLVRGENMELGRDSDTGGQIKYMVELAGALAKMPGVYRVDLFTRQVASPEVDWSYGEPTEMISAGPEDAEVGQIGDGQPVWPYVIHGHYADVGDIVALLSGALNVHMVLTGHSLGRNKLEQLLKQGRQSKEDIKNFAPEGTSIVAKLSNIPRWYKTDNHVAQFHLEGKVDFKGGSIVTNYFSFCIPLVKGNIVIS